MASKSSVISSGSDDPWDFGVGGIINADYAPEEEHALLIAAANILLLHHLMDMEKESKKVDRMHRAITYIVEDQTQALAAAAGTVRSIDLTGPPDKLRQAIYKRTPEKICLALIVSALMNPPFAPYEIPVKGRRREKALVRLTSDLGIPKTWVKDAVKAIEGAHDAQRSKGKIVTGAVVAVAGIGLAFLALPLATIFAPVGVAGGAALLSGLAALGGTTGVMGGIAVITAVGALGGVTAISGALVAGSAKEVELRVLLLHGTAIAKARIRPGTKPVREIHTLENMKLELDTQLHRHETVDLRAHAKKEIKRKLEITTNALDAINQQFAGKV